MNLKIEISLGWWWQMVFNPASAFPQTNIIPSYDFRLIYLLVLKCQYSKICQKLIVAFNYDNCVVIKYPLKEHIPPQTTMEVKPSFLPARLMNNSESLCGMNKWFNNEHQQSSHIVALTSKWDEVDEEEGCYYTLGHRVCVRTPSVKPAAGSPAQVSLETDAFCFYFWRSEEKKKKNLLCMMQKRCEQPVQINSYQSSTDTQMWSGTVFSRFFLLCPRIINFITSMGYRNGFSP